MTNKEAIKELQSYADNSWGGLNEAFEMAIAALREQEKLESKLRVFESSGWISVEDALPDASADVNLCTRSGIVGTGYYDKYRKSWVQYYAGGALCVDVTHWMPLPSKPEVEG